MTAWDFFFISVGVGVWILVVMLAYVLYKTSKFVNFLHQTLGELNLEYKTIKSGIKLGALSLLTKFLGQKKGGGRNKQIKG